MLEIILLCVILYYIIININITLETILIGLFLRGFILNLYFYCTLIEIYIFERGSSSRKL